MGHYANNSYSNLKQYLLVQINQISIMKKSKDWREKQVDLCSLDAMETVLLDLNQLHFNEKINSEHIQLCKELSILIRDKRNVINS